MWSLLHMLTYKLVYWSLTFKQEHIDVYIDSLRTEVFLSALGNVYKNWTLKLDFKKVGELF